MSVTPKLELPELATAQASKEITHNEALRRIEQATQPTVLSMVMTAPPGSPADGDAYIVAAPATGDWAGHEDEIAFYAGTAWAFITPQEGWQVCDQTGLAQYQYAGTDGWQVFDPAFGAYQPIDAFLTALSGLSDSDGGLVLFNSDETASLITLDTDVTLAANSDTAVPSQKAIKTFVSNLVTGALKFITSTDCSGNPNYPAATKGDAYVVSVAGKIGGASGPSVDVGDVYFAIANNAGGTQAAVGSSWDILEHNLAGALLAANNLGDVLNAGTALTNLGGTTIGKAVFTLANPSAIRYPRYNADNTVTALTLAQLQADLQDTGLDADAVGLRGIPQNSQSGNYTTVAADAGKHIYHASGAGAGDTFTIDSNDNVAYEVGTAITFVNMDSNALSIAITSDTLYLAGTGTTGTRSLAQYGSATALKLTSTTWLISGTGLT